MKMIDIEENSEDLKGICMQFHFKNKELNQEFSNCLLFAKKDKIIAFDYNNDEIKVIHQLSDAKRGTARQLKMKLKDVD